ncbi:MAG: UPF0182 family protein, partial [bacterium]|nr:UPF0182 family protein [bacterium]
MRRGLWLTVGIIALALLVFGGKLVNFYTEWLWFGEVGYSSVLWTRVYAQAALALGAGLLFFALLYPNLRFALRSSAAVLSHNDAGTLRIDFGRIAQRSLGIIAFLAALVAAFLVALDASTHWLQLSTFINAGSFGETDPVFNRDIGFYVFRLGFLRYAYGWLMFTLVITALASAAVHYLRRAVDVISGKLSLAPHVNAHLSVILAGIFFLKAWGYRLDAYELLYSPTGVVFGAGYTDVHARLAAYNILFVIALAAGVLALVNIFLKGIRLPVAAVAVLAGASLLAGGIYPGIVQQTYVKPNEIARESKYISNNIRMTRRAFNLDRIETKYFPAEEKLTSRSIRDNKAIINSVRLWDYRPLDKTYSQLQELWQHYKISNIDIDRYLINDELRQVTLSARELSLQGDASGAATWVNRHFQYTHGYGAVMSPVNRATEGGLPEFFISGLPPKSNVGIDINQPQIYFGEMTADYALVRTNEKEFDYPSQDQPVYTSYQGRGGIPVGGYLRRLAFAWRFSELNLALKNPVSKDSRLMFRRQIQERMQAVMPFLVYDPDPYPVVSNGRLYWMCDAYSVSQRYPYSTPYSIADGRNVNYIRNSVKVVVDAYEGTVDYYVSDADDPIISTMARIFPGTFKPLHNMPQGLRSH